MDFKNLPPNFPFDESETFSQAGLILLVDDEPLLLRSLERILVGDGFLVAVARSPEEIEPFLRNPNLSLVLLDLFMHGTSGLDLLDRIKRERPEVEVVMMTGHASIETAVKAMRRGAFDYLEKPFDDIHRVRTTLQQALQKRALVQRNRELEEVLRGRSASAQLIGNSPKMRALSRVIQSLRHNESNVLIHGESGTGKELVARALHETSPRAKKPFVPIDCGALPESIIESELFGHEKGAFTGAVGAPGLFRIASGGTLFLDEVGELPQSVQAKLLRALQYKEVRPVGASEAVRVDLRLISATHRDLEKMVEAQSFRMDLFYRLNVVRVEIPSLRERKEDIPLLVHHFMQKYRHAESRIAGIDDNALDMLSSYEWPGNVRELENAIESAMATARGTTLQTKDLLLSRRTSVSLASAPRGIALSLDAYERCAIERALREVGGDVREAARVLGVGRSTLYRKLAKHGLVPSQ